MDNIISIFFKDKIIVVEDAQNVKDINDFDRLDLKVSLIEKKKNIKELIETAKSNEYADNVIENFFHFKTIEEKIAFLYGMFDIHELDHFNDKLEIYHAMLYTIRTSAQL